MDKAQRGNLLRERLKTRFPMQALPVPKSGARFKWWESQGTGQISRGGVGLSERHCERPRKLWVQTPDAVPKSGPKPSRKTQISPLTKIAEGYPVRLPRDLK